MLKNPFSIGWNKGWTFLFFLEGGAAKIEARGYGISITTKIKNGETPFESADRLIFKEQRMRRTRYISWNRSLYKK